MRDALDVPGIREANHWALLSATRFYLAFVVFVAHFGMTIAPDPNWPLVYPWYLFGRQLGPLAAILGFLVISGFSIAQSYERPDRFYGRRAGRIWPSLMVATVGFALASHLAGASTTASGATHYPPPITSVIGTLLTVNAFFWGSFLGPTWSLSAEAFFYVATPLLSRARRLLLLLLMAASAALYWNNEAWRLGPLPGLQYGLGAASLFWAWGAGFLFQRRPGVVTGFLLAAAGPVLLTQWNYEGGIYASHTWLIAVGAVVAGGSLDLDLGGARKLLNYLGDLSYPLYLIHYPIIAIANGVYGMNDFGWLLAVSLAASALCLHAVEIPLRGRIARLPLFGMGPERHAALILFTLLAATLLVNGLPTWLRG